MKHKSQNLRTYNKQKKVHGNQQNKHPKAGEIWIINLLKFDGDSGCKDRPIVVISSDGDTVNYFQCTTQPSSFRDRYEILDTVYAGLDRITFVDLEKKTISSKKLSYKVGELSEIDSDALKI